MNHCYLFLLFSFYYKSQAKNLILAGPKSVAIYDPEPATIADCGSNVSIVIIELSNKKFKKNAVIKEYVQY